MENIMKIDNGSFDGFDGVTAGVQVADRWQYNPIGYNATNGNFYVGEDEAHRYGGRRYADAAPGGRHGGG